MLDAMCALIFGLGLDELDNVKLLSLCYNWGFMNEKDDWK